MKNQIYITTKREKLIDEIVEIRKDFRKIKMGEILNLGIVDEKKALSVKFYQLSIIKKISEVSESILKKWLRLCRKKICRACRNGLRKGDLQCQKDFRIMILADMLRRSL